MMPQCGCFVECSALSSCAMTAVPSPAVRLTARFEGHVQGVGFRYTAIEIAERLGVTDGYVMNLMNGDVEVVAEGQEATLRELLTRIQCSHLGRYILRIDQQWSPARGGFQGFDVRFTER
jgi:acylphosphatase